MFPCPDKFCFYFRFIVFVLKGNTSKNVPLIVLCSLSSDQMSSKLTESKAHQTQRGRLIKPKPNLQRISRQQPQQVHKTKPIEAGGTLLK